MKYYETKEDRVAKEDLVTKAKPWVACAPLSSLYSLLACNPRPLLICKRWCLLICSRFAIYYSPLQNRSPLLKKNAVAFLCLCVTCKQRFGTPTCIPSHPPAHLRS